MPQKENVHIFKKLDHMAKQLKHERDKADRALETARRSLRDREQLQAQLREARHRAQDSVAGAAEVSPEQALEGLREAFDTLTAVNLFADDDESDEAEAAGPSGLKSSQQPPAVSSSAASVPSLAASPLSLQQLRTPPPRKPASSEPGEEARLTPPAFRHGPVIVAGEQQTSKEGAVASSSESAAPGAVGCEEPPAAAQTATLVATVADEQTAKVPEADAPMAAVASAPATKAAVAVPYEPAAMMAAAPLTSVAVSDAPATVPVEAVDVRWAPNSQNCALCSTAFNLFVRRHHCRSCGQCICAKCSPFRVALESRVQRPTQQRRCFSAGDIYKTREHLNAAMQAHRICGGCHRISHWFVQGRPSTSRMSLDS